MVTPPIGLDMGGINFMGGNNTGDVSFITFGVVDGDGNITGSLLDVAGRSTAGSASLTGTSGSASCIVAV